MNAWVTLLTDPGYLPGVRTLKASLDLVGHTEPFVVMVTGGVDAASRRTLADDGCVVREVAPLRPRDGLADHYANARFAEVWTKLGVWGFTEYERVVVLDADMLVTRPMPEVFTMDLPGGAIAACHACRCNPNRIPTYPADWVPANCFYSYCRGPEHTSEPGVENHLNGGFLVLRPDAAVFDDLVRRLAEVDDLSRFVFAEQDFLDEYYRDRWIPLSYAYNALKTLPFQHPQMWDEAAVKNIHYIIDKPWQRNPDPDDKYFDVETLWWQVADKAGTAVRPG